MLRRLLVAVAVIGLLAGAVRPASAQHVDANALPSLDDEAWAGISYRDAIVGAAVLAGGGFVVAWLTGSTISGITAAAAVAAGYLIYDPGAIGVLSTSDLPTLRDLAVNKARPE